VVTNLHITDLIHENFVNVQEIILTRRQIGGQNVFGFIGGRICGFRDYNDDEKSRAKDD